MGETALFLAGIVGIIAVVVIIRRLANPPWRCHNCRQPMSIRVYQVYLKGRGAQPPVDICPACYRLWTMGYLD